MKQVISKPDRVVNFMNNPPQLLCDQWGGEVHCRRPSLLTYYQVTRPTAFLRRTITSPCRLSHRDEVFLQ